MIVILPRAEYETHCRIFAIVTEAHEQNNLLTQARSKLNNNNVKFG